MLSTSWSAASPFSARCDEPSACRESAPGAGGRLSAPRRTSQTFDDVLTVDPPEHLTLMRDPGDNRILEAAVAGEADYVITGDRQLLALGTYGGTAFVTPAAFREILDAIS